VTLHAKLNRMAYRWLTKNKEAESPQASLVRLLKRARRLKA